jgi:predicted Ser/Thr protein kinase
MSVAIPDDPGGTSMGEMDELASLLPPAAPRDPPLEQARMRRHVRAALFGAEVEPTYVGRFRLLECIGQGGMGVVWSAHDDALDRTVAIKLLRRELGGDMITEEARALARLAHPNVVGVFDIGIHDGQRFFAMEYVPGETLRQWLAREHSTAGVVEMFLAAGRGLAAAHAVGLVHRDFKPDNVLVGGDGRPRVLDFGLARAPSGGLGRPPRLDHDADPRATALGESGVLLGTPAYMAPEQHYGEAADAKSDQFAFGVSLLEGLTGAPPFWGDDLRALSLAIVRGRLTDPDRLERIAAPLRRVILRAIAVEPSARYPDMDALLHELGQTIATAPTEAMAPRGAAPVFHTAQIEQVLARAAALGSEAADRPGLGLGELERIGAEVGIDAQLVRRAAAETSFASSPPAAFRPAALARLDTATDDRDHAFGREIHSTRALALRPTPRLNALLVRELERREGKGEVEYLGASVAWSNRKLEVHLDPTATGGALALRRSQRGRATRRSILATAGGVIAGASMGAPLLAEMEGAIGAGLVAVGILLSMTFGALGLRRLAARMHRKDLQRRQRQLEYDNDRLVALLEGNADSA